MKSEPSSRVDVLSSGQPLPRKYRRRWRSTWLWVAVLSAAVLSGLYFTALWRGSRQPPSMILGPHDSFVTDLAFSSDGQCLFVAAGRTVTMWQIDTGKIVRRFEGHVTRVNGIAVSPDDRHLLSASGDYVARGQKLIGDTDNTLRVWDISTGRQLSCIQGGSRLLLSVAWAPNGRDAVTGSEDGSVYLWQPLETKESRLVGRHGPPVFSVCFSHDSKWVLSTGRGDYVCVWKADGEYPKSQISSFRLLADYNAAAFTPDDRYVIAAAGEGKIVMWDMISQKRRNLFSDENAEIACASLSPDGRLLCLSMSDHILCFLDVNLGHELFRISHGHDHASPPPWAPILRVAFSPSGNTVAVGGEDGAVRIFDLHGKPPP